MARRRRQNYGYGRSTAAPQPVKAVKPVVNPAGLIEAYDWMPVNKMQSYKLALEWYTTNLQALMYGMTIDAATQKDLERAQKSKEIGDSSPHDPEKDVAYRRTLSFYEKVWASFKLPKVEDALKATVAGKSVAGIQTVLGNFAAAYASFNVRFLLTMDAVGEVNKSEILLPYADLAAMVGDAPLKTVVTAAHSVATALSIDMVDGKEHFDGDKYLAAMPGVLGAATSWALGTAGATKPISKIVTPRAAKAANGTVTPGGPITRTRRWAESDVIHVLVPGNPFKGQMNIKYALVRDGMTIGEFKKARRALGNMGAGVGPIEDGVKRGLLDVRS